MDLFQSVDPLLKLDVVCWKLCLRAQSACAVTDGREKGQTFSSAWPSCSLTNCCVRAAKGVNEALRRGTRVSEDSVI